jgi:hypothetical protein
MEQWSMGVVEYWEEKKRSTFNVQRSTVTLNIEPALWNEAHIDHKPE